MMAPPEAGPRLRNPLIAESATEMLHVSESRSPSCSHASQPSAEARPIQPARIPAWQHSATMRMPRRRSRPTATCPHARNRPAHLRHPLVKLPLLPACAHTKAVRLFTCQCTPQYQRLGVWYSKCVVVYGLHNFIAVWEPVQSPCAAADMQVAYWDTDGTRGAVVLGRGMSRCPAASVCNPETCVFMCSAAATCRPLGHAGHAASRPGNATSGPSATSPGARSSACSGAVPCRASGCACRACPYPRAGPGRN